MQASQDVKVIFQHQAIFSQFQFGPQLNQIYYETLFDGPKKKKKNLEVLPAEQCNE
jgi:hypothetical protein